MYRLSTFLQKFIFSVCSLALIATIALFSRSLAFLAFILFFCLALIISVFDMERTYGYPLEEEEDAAE